MARGRLGPELEVGPGGASCELCAEPYASLVLDLQGCNLSQKCPGAWGWHQERLVSHPSTGQGLLVGKRCPVPPRYCAGGDSVMETIIWGKKGLLFLPKWGLGSRWQLFSCPPPVTGGL